MYIAMFGSQGYDLVVFSGGQAQFGLDVCKGLKLEYYIRRTRSSPS